MAFALCCSLIRRIFDLNQVSPVKYLLIVFIIFLALAPLSHFVPSKRQRRVARLREYAAVHGLFVEFRQLPGDDRAIGRGQGARGDIIYYGKRLPPARHGQPEPTAAWLCYEDGWRGITTGQRTVPPVLEQLPAGMLAASVDQGSCGIYWLEPGEEAAVAEIQAVLERWSAQLRPT
jgi:hypothetical protein